MFDTSASGTGGPTPDPTGLPPDAETGAQVGLPVAPGPGAQPSASVTAAAPSAGRSPSAGGVPSVSAFAASLAELPRNAPDADLLDLIRNLEEIKAAAAAAQAQAAAAFDASQREAQREAGVRKEKLGEGIASQIALARRDSPARGSRHLGMAHALTTEMPHTLAALTNGVLSEWRATLLVRETVCLNSTDRTRVDEALAADPSKLEGLGDKRLVAAAKKEAYRLDPHSVVARAAKATSERTVTCRPAPDTMTYLTGLLPVAHGVAVHAALQRTADHLRATGDERSRGQIMADTLVDRITRPAQHDRKPATAAGADIEIQLVMTDRALLAGDHEPAHLTGYGTIPAGHARNLILGPRTTRTDDETRAWIRRLYTAPGAGQLVAMDSAARTFPKNLRKMIITRDQTCRTPWCDAPIRHIDHILSHGVGGRTNEANGAGLCERCNLAKTAPGNRATPIASKRHTFEVTTPTGHLYRSTAPPLPGATPARPSGTTEPTPARSITPKIPPPPRRRRQIGTG